MTELEPDDVESEDELETFDEPTDWAAQNHCTSVSPNATMIQGDGNDHNEPNADDEGYDGDDGFWYGWDGNWSVEIDTGKPFVSYFGNWIPAARFRSRRSASSPAARRRWRSFVQERPPHRPTCSGVL